MPLSDAEYKKRYGVTRKEAEAARAKTRSSAAYKKKRAELAAAKKTKKTRLKAEDMPKGWARKEPAAKKPAAKKSAPGTRVKNSDGRFVYPKPGPSNSTGGQGGGRRSTGPSGKGRSGGRSTGGRSGKK
jgi:membrane protein involved in colicin uptake